MLDEMISLLPILQSADSKSLLDKEIGENNILQLGKAKTRQRMIFEFKRRYEAMPPSFWNWFLTLPCHEQPIAFYYCLLRTYLTLKDVHVNLFAPKLKSADPTVSKAEVTRYIHEIGAGDEFVDSWSDATKDRVASSCLAYVRAIGMLDHTSGALRPVPIEGALAAAFVRRDEAWYLEALGMPLFEINRIKESGLNKQ